MLNDQKSRGLDYKLKSVVVASSTKTVLVAKLTSVLVFMQNVTLGTANLHLTFTKVDRIFSKPLVNI